MLAGHGAAPRIIIVMHDQWRRALLRAALREVGYDAIGTRALREALLVRPTASDRGSVSAIVLDQADLDANAVSPLRARHGMPPVVLLARATVAEPEGEWARVLRRPFSVEDVVGTIEALVPLPDAARHALDENEQSDYS